MRGNYFFQSAGELCDKHAQGNQILLTCSYCTDDLRKRLTAAERVVEAARKIIGLPHGSSYSAEYTELAFAVCAYEDTLSDRAKDGK